MSKQLVTILEKDEGAKTCHVQVNDEAAIGTDAEGKNFRHQFAAAITKGKEQEQPEGTEPWKGSVGESLSALYPGATLHTPDSLNAVVKDTLLKKGLRVERKDGSLVTPAEDALLTKREEEAAAEAARVVKAEEERVEQERQAELRRIEQEKIALEAKDVGDAGATIEGA